MFKDKNQVKLLEDKYSMLWMFMRSPSIFFPTDDLKNTYFTVKKLMTYAAECYCPVQSID